MTRKRNLQGLLVVVDLDKLPYDLAADAARGASDQDVFACELFHELQRGFERLEVIVRRLARSGVTEH